MKSIFIFLIQISFFGGLAHADPLLPGGAATHTDMSSDSFNHQAPNNTVETQDAFVTGNSRFRSSWVQAGSSTTGLDGLGPTFNATSCGACHSQDGRGIGFSGKPGAEKVSLSMLFRLSQKMPDGTIVPHPDYGGQLNPFHIQNVPGEATPQVVFEKVVGTFGDGTSYELRRPVFTFVDFSFRPFDGNTLISPRVAPHLIGLGLVEAIAANDIMANADPLDENHDGISGKANIVLDVETQQMVLGRFGWKAGQPSLRQQDAAAFNGDMGLTTTLFPEQNCPLVQTACAQALTGGDPEVEPKILDRVTVYTQTLGVPARRNADHADVIAGERKFIEIGCASCHTPTFTTGNDHEIETLRGQQIYPYSDFLLHDMGEDLADHRPEALADGNEWRTPPLWGVGMFHKVSKHQNLLHDSRARGVEEAVLWHGGEAAAARDNYKNLNLTDRQSVVSFVNSL
jgi:CxxC motif-containing protein (DUF1111 family)